MANKQNYMKKMEAKNLLKQEAGLMSDRFPKVNGIVINMTYYHRAENPVLMQRTVNYYPSSYAHFNMECMIRGCEEGGFDLTRIVKKQIKDSKKHSKGEMVCKGKNGDLASNHSHISYEISVKYSTKTTKPKATTKAKPKAAAKAKPKTATKTKAKTKTKVAKKTKAKAKK